MDLQHTDRLQIIEKQYYTTRIYNDVALQHGNSHFNSILHH